MAARKPPSDKRLTSSPFKSLKGLSVSDRPNAADQQAPVPQADEQREVSSAPRPPVADDELFQREMASLGVNRRLGRDHAELGRAEQSGPDRPEAAEELSEDEVQLFESAVGRLDKTFARNDSKESDRRPRARRARQLKQGRIRPEAQLDLHGLRREEALTRVGYFLENARHHGFTCVLIITGKGTRSPDGAVLRAAVLDWLAANREGLLEWIEAPRQYGGSGALAVFLRRPESRS